jgi:DNA-directed RNA polymerase subunit RPC12/RpoP
VSWSKYSDRARKRSRRSRRNRGGKGKGGGAFFADEWRLPGDKSPLPFERIRFFPGDYVECEKCETLTLASGDKYKCWHCGHEGGYGDETYMQPTMPNYRVHWPTGGKSRRGAGVVCRCHDGALKAPNGKTLNCVVCHYGYVHHDDVVAKAEAEYGENLPRDVWRKANQKLPRMHMAHNLIRLGYFHPVQQESEAGTKYTIYEHCLNGIRSSSGRQLTCKMCEAGVERIHGRRAYWNPTEPLGNRGYLATLRDYEEDQLSSTCASCGETIQPIHYSCASCGDIVVDCNDETVDEEILKKARKEPMACPKCGHKAVLDEYVQCIKEEEPGEWVVGCSDPVRLSIFDVNLSMSITGKRLDAKLKIHGHDMEPLDPALVDLAIPYDFKDLLQMSTGIQAARMNVDDPFSDKKEEGAKSRDYKDEDK